ncbi:hypothetical protein O6H91_Y084000 [Diphasiastrum complanatum]|nr:hypothetical protein O6H91_Y084000 [Diphasiastrum complanatum]
MQQRKEHSVKDQLYASKHSSQMSASEIHNHLQALNKPGVKTILSPDGDTIVCVPIDQQLAFDNPLLRNHKIRKQPPSLAGAGVSFTNVKASNQFQQLWQLAGNCPEETIPVRQAKKEDLLRAGSVAPFARKPPENNETLAQKHEHAIAYTGGQYYGAQASINVWKPEVQKNEYSLSQVWAQAGTRQIDLNSVEAGWHVDPALYGDDNPRVFAYWTNDSYNTQGCFNHFCAGFIQVNNNVTLGAAIPYSTYNGAQHEITIAIAKSDKWGDWWVKIGDDFIGYFPAEIIPRLATGTATTLMWGGEVYNTRPSGKHTKTQMGSGVVPYKGYRHASYFTYIFYLNATYYLITPSNLELIQEFPNCYSIGLSPVSDPNEEKSFYYGGPGLNSQCP